MWRSWQNSDQRSWSSEIEARERLEQELVHISEREQRRVGHDIHDSLCQHLTGTALAGQVLVQTLQAQNSASAPTARPAWSNSSKTASRCRATSRGG